jgi:Na+-driven multidrug efflux pump
MFSMWCIRILSTYLCVSVFKFGLNAVWLCMIADNLVRFIMLLIRFIRGNWKRNLYA